MEAGSNSNRQVTQAPGAERQELFSMLELLPVFVYLQTREHSFRFVNRKFRELFGDPEGRSCFDVFHGLKEPCPTCRKLRVFETQTPSNWEWTSPGGRVYNIAEAPYKDADGTVLVLGTGIDVTAYRQAEEALRLSQKFLEIANRHAKMISLLNHFVAEIKSVTGCLAVGIRIFDEEKKLCDRDLEGSSRQSPDPQDLLSLDSAQCVCINKVQGDIDINRPFYTCEGVFHVNCSADLLAQTADAGEKGGFCSIWTQLGYKSTALVPIRLGASVLGFIHIAHAEKNLQPERAVEIARIAATQLAIAIQRVRVNQLLEKAHDELELRVAERTCELAQANEQLKNEVEERKRWEEALKESEELHRTLTESVADGVMLVQDGKIVLANAALVQMFGYSDANELMGGDVTDLFESEAREELIRILGLSSHGDAVGANGAATLRGICLANHDKRFWTLTHFRVLHLKSRPAILGTMRDITDVVSREAEIREEADCLRKENIRLKHSIKERYKFGDIIGKSAAMQEVYELILKAATTEASVIIFGESGTGKELVAHAIHDAGEGGDRPFIPVNCGAIPEGLAESEFFGHRKGAFTGAYTDKPGYLSSSNEGTLFLDEVGEIGLNLQVKLLRAIETGEYTPVGDTKVRRARFRCIAATNRNLQEMVRAGLMREDFFYRIAVVPINLPPLRNRKDDIALLVEHFLRLYNNGRPLPTIPGEVMDALQSYNWPGNVRELQNVIQRYLTVGRLDFMNPDARLDSCWNAGQTGKSGGDLLSDALINFEKELLLNALRESGGNKSKAAAMLGIGRRSLLRKMDRVGIR